MAGVTLSQVYEQDSQFDFSSDSSNYGLAPTFALQSSILLPSSILSTNFTSSLLDFTSALPSHLLLSLDSNLFIYNYSTLALSSYSELTSTITAFATLIPLPIFTPEITSILVIATVDSIHIIGLSYSNSEITFYQTGLEMGITTTIVALKGTNDGRVFALDQAGDLYQLNYQSTEGWFTKRLSLQNITQRANYTNPLLPTFLSALAQSSDSERIIDFSLDLERGLIYTLLKNHSIEMYSLPTNGKPTLLCTLKDILQKSMGQSPQLPMLNSRNFEIISLSPITLLESNSLGNGTEKICLVATTSLGVRIYFTHNKRSYYGQTNSSNFQSLEIALIKAPPTGANTSGLGENGMIALNSMTRFMIGEGGFFIGANSSTEEVGLDEEDLLACIAPDFGRISRSIGSGIVNTTIGGKSEKVTLIKIPGRTWSIKPLPLDLPSPLRISNPTSSKWKLNELSTQILSAPLRFLILTNMGIHLVSRRRVIDGLVDILGRISVGGGSGDSGLGEVEVFFEEFGRDQSSSMLLAIASSNTHLFSPLSFSANSASVDSREAARNGDRALVERAKSLFFQGAGRAVGIEERFNATAKEGEVRTMDSYKIHYSGKYMGITIYIARLLRVIWMERISIKTPTPQNTTAELSNFTPSVLLSLQQNLIGLRDLVLSDSQFAPYLPSTSTARLLPTATLPEKFDHEETLAIQVQIAKLLKTIEAISFLLLLIDYGWSEIISTYLVEGEDGISWEGITFRELVEEEKGREIVRGIIGVVIRRIGGNGNGGNVESVAEVLKERCGSFCDGDDLIVYKAIELLRKAGEVPEKGLLLEAMRLFKLAIKALGVTKLDEVVNEFKRLGEESMGVEVGLWWLSHASNLVGKDGKKIGELKVGEWESVYETIFDCLEEADRKLDLAVKEGKNYERADNQRTALYNKVLASNDEKFHEKLYDWFLKRGLSDLLLETRTPYLEAYLGRDGKDLIKFDLLWQYYVRISKFDQAAGILGALADSDLFDLTLAKRVEYLSLAVSNLKSQSTLSMVNSGNIDFLQEMEEKLEVALIQIEIYQSLPSGGAINWAERIEQRLFTITELYTEFALPLRLSEVILLIFHVSGHQDAEIIQDTWSEILEKVQNVSSDRQIETLESKIVSLGRKFGNNTSAYPLLYLLNLFETYSWTAQSTLLPRAGWVPLSFLEAGISAEAVFRAFESLFQSRPQPWYTPTSLNFLIKDFVTFVSYWLNEEGKTGNFLATEVDVLVGKVGMLAGEGELQELLGKVGRDIRRKF